LGRGSGGAEVILFFLLKEGQGNPFYDLVLFPYVFSGHLTNESIIEKTYFVKSPLTPAKEGKFLPFARCASACTASKGREGGIRGLMNR
jgi:hypothetical protein